jgi:DNA repair protein SbcD/Mre11
VKSLRICHLADVHLGYRRFHKLTKSGHNQREVDVALAFREALRQVIALKPDITIIAGDLFHSVRPSNAVITFAFRELRNLVELSGAPVVLIAGNHESPKRADTGCVLRLFSEIPGVFVADLKTEVFDFPERNLSVTAVPHLALPTVVEQRVTPNDAREYNVLVLHGQVNGHQMTDFGGGVLHLDDVSRHAWDYIALGHVHCFQRVGLNGAYAGAIEHTSFNIWTDENTKKGFLEVILPVGDTKFHPLTTPRTILALPAIDAAAKESHEVEAAIIEEMLRVPGGMSGKIVRLDVYNISKATLRHLNHKRLREARAEALHFTLDFHASTELTSPLHGSAKRGARLSDELHDFARSFPLEGASFLEMEDLLKRYLTKVSEEDEARRA